MNWGECYFDHYEGIFGVSKTQAVFESRPGRPRIQVLGYDGIFGSGTRVLCTLGMTHYAATVGGVVELMLPVDDVFTDAQEAFANACFFAADNNVRIGVGTVIDGVENVAPKIATQYGKSAIYVTDPYGLPAGAGMVSCVGQVGSLYMAFFISRAEREYLREKGFAEFEGLLQAKEVDPIAVGRPSAC